MLFNFTITFPIGDIAEAAGIDGTAAAHHAEANVAELVDTVTPAIVAWLHAAGLPDLQPEPEPPVGLTLEERVAKIEGALSSTNP